MWAVGGGFGVEKSRSLFQKEIWDELMITCVCRCVASVYSVVLLYMLVRVQVNILAGEMYKRRSRSSHASFADSLVTSPVEAGEVESITDEMAHSREGKLLFGF